MRELGEMEREGWRGNASNHGNAHNETVCTLIVLATSLFSIANN